MFRGFRLPAVVLAGFLIGTISPARPSNADEPLDAQQEAVQQLRRFTTNMQFHEDGSVRLVRLSKPVVTDEMLDHLRHFTELDYLAVTCPSVTDRGLRSIRPLTKLDTLLLSESGVSDAGLEHLSELKNLQRLYLADTAVGDEGLRRLGSLPQLNTLDLQRCQVTDAGLEALAALPALETLLLSETQVTDQGIRHLARLPRLRVLYLNGCRIDGQGLGELHVLEQLQYLGLSGTGVTNETLAELGKLRQLKHLELYRTAVGAEGLQRLRQALPDTVLHADPNLKAPPERKPDSHVADGGAVVEEQAGDDGGLSPVSKLLPPIRERLASQEVTPDFQRHVIPLLGRLGCNGRNCHGSFQGQGGFRLSMFGYDFEVDRENLVERIDEEAPAESLVLRKPTSEDDHGGGLRLPREGWQYELLRRWIAAGGTGVADDAPRFVRLDVTPEEVVFERPGQSVQLRVVAVWSDGAREDVTDLTRFQSNDEAVAEVTPDGRITARSAGDTYVISFYDNGIFSTQVLQPVSDQVGEAYPDVPAGTPLDEPVLAKLRKLGIVPAPLCGDAQFLRRISLDLTGTLPTPGEIRQFLADPAPDKRAAKVDELLERPAYVTWWTTRLCDLTGSNAGYLGGTEMAQPVAAQWRDWIERRVRDNVGWDRIAKGILLATSRRPGQPYDEFVREQSEYTRSQSPADFAAPGNPMPHFWFRSNLAQPGDKALAFGYSFLGIRLDCAQCHKHPYDQWSKRDFELFTEFFTRIKAGVAPDAEPLHEQLRNMLGVPVKLNTAALRRQSYLRIAAEGRPIPWQEVYIEPPAGKPQPARLLAGQYLDLSDYGDPREPLVQWLLNEPNRYFAKAFVNRIWANYFHVGIIDPPDDLNLANPPGNKALLDQLVRGFIASGYDMKWLHRTIANSHTYQRDWRTNETNRTDERNFSRAVVRRLPAEVAIDAVLQATAGDAALEKLARDTANRKIAQHPRSFQARSIDYSLLVFGKPLRTTNCDCERRGEPTLLQALYLRNDQELHAALQRPDGWLAQLRQESGDPRNVDDRIREAYLRTLSRQPTERELSDSRDYLAGVEDPHEGLQDLFWALLNTREFITNH